MVIGGVVATADHTYIAVLWLIWGGDQRHRECPLEIWCGMSTWGWGEFPVVNIPHSFPGESLIAGLLL